MIHFLHPGRLPDIWSRPDTFEWNSLQRLVLFQLTMALLIHFSTVECFDLYLHFTFAVGIFSNCTKILASLWSQANVGPGTRPRLKRCQTRISYPTLIRVRNIHRPRRYLCNLIRLWYGRVWGALRVRVSMYQPMPFVEPDVHIASPGLVNWGKYRMLRME
jgi:hypothetical protein